MSIRRVTTEILFSKQPRPYADHILHVRVSFESDGWKPADKGVLSPQRMSEKFARSELKRLGIGFTELTRADKGPSMDDHFKTHLDWLKPIDGIPASEQIEGGDPTQIVASIWEFQTTTPFAD